MQDLFGAGTGYERFIPVVVKIITRFTVLCTYLNSCTDIVRYPKEVHFKSQIFGKVDCMALLYTGRS